MGRFCLSVLLWVVAQGQAALPPGHPPAESAQAAPSMEELLRRLDAQSDLKTRDKPFDVCVSIENCISRMVDLPMPQNF